MNNDLDRIRNECSAKKRENVSTEDLIAYLHDNGCSIVQSMVVLMQVYNRSLRDVEIDVTAHPCWRGIVKAAEPLYDELEEIFLQGTDGNG